MPRRSTCLPLLMLLVLFVGCATDSAPPVASAAVTHQPEISELIRIQPWNGYRGALSLTFDDGDPSQETIVQRELDSRGIKATFNITVANISDPEIWTTAAGNGHEIGNHSWYHRRVWELTPRRMDTEVDAAGARLAEISGHEIRTFAYPYSGISPALKNRLIDHYTAARGGQHPPLVMRPERDVDWLEIPSFVVREFYPASLVLAWKDMAVDTGSWCVLMFHAVEGSAWGYEPYPLQSFRDVLDGLEDQEGLWLAPFGTVAAYWRAQKTVENSRLEFNGTTATIQWKVPEYFSEGIKLKMEVQKGWVAVQNNQALIRDNEGIVLLDFDAGELFLMLEEGETE